jgi:hypothetical protein
MRSMKSPHPRRLTASDETEGLSGPYDGAEPEDPWFLPEAAEDPEPAPFAPRRERLIFEPEEWRDAEGVLAALCHDAGRLAERLEAPPGGAERLALQEAASLSWWSGDRIGADRLGLWLALRLGATGEDAPGVARAAWAARRLGAARPRAGDWGTVIGGHLGLSGEDRVGDPSRVGQTGLDHLAAAESRSEAALDHLADTCEGLEPMAGLSPVTLGCLGFHLWRMADPAPPDGLPADPRVREVEAAVLGARLAAGFGAGQGLLFLPLTLTGFSALTASGPAERRLSAWIAGAHQATLSALLLLKRLSDWQAAAAQATADLSGRTPARLIACLARWPLVSAPLAEAETGASRAAVQRNLDLLVARGLAREATGQGRYRVWAAAV